MLVKCSNTLCKKPCAHQDPHEYMASCERPCGQTTKDSHCTMISEAPPLEVLNRKMDFIIQLLTKLSEQEISK